MDLSDCWIDQLIRFYFPNLIAFCLVNTAPKLKGRPRKCNNKNQLQNFSQESDTSVESKVRPTRRNTLKTRNNGINKSALTRNNPDKANLSRKLVEKCLKNEQEFIKQLYKFMKERKTPIQRIPHLGFKKSKLVCSQLIYILRVNIFFCFF